MGNVERRMATCDVKTVIVPLKEAMADGCFEVIQCQARYDGGYWNTTGIGRVITCHGLVRAMQRKASRCSRTAPRVAATTRCVLSGTRTCSLLICSSMHRGGTLHSSPSSLDARRWLHTSRTLASKPSST